MNTAIETEKYFYVVHGVIPELMARVAYRRAGRSELHARKVIKCPYCGDALTDVDRAAKVALYRYPARREVSCQVYKKCETCKGEVGIILA